MRWRRLVICICLPPEGGGQKRYQLVDSIDKLNKANKVRGGWQQALFLADHDSELPEALKEAQEEISTRKNVYAADTLAWCLFKNGLRSRSRRHDSESAEIQHA